MSVTTTRAERLRLERQQEAVLQISHRWRVPEHEFDQATAAIVEASSLAVGVERTGVWIFDEANRSVTCSDLFEATPRKHSSGQTLGAAEISDYVEAMPGEEFIEITDTSTDPRAIGAYDTYFKPLNIGSVLDAPIRHDGRVIGILSHEHVGGTRDFTEDEKRSAMFFANLVSLAYDTHHRHESQRESARKVSLLNAAFEATGAGIISIDMNGSVTFFNKLVVDMFGYTEEMMGAAGDNGPRAAYVASLGVDPEKIMGIWRSAHAVPTAERVDVFEMKDGRSIECSSQPQRLDGEVIGRVWSFRDVTYQRKLEQELRELAIRDTLTGLYNRRWADDELEKEMRRAARTKQPLCVAMLDIDLFKAVNDVHGHHVGDRVLCALAEDFRKRLRATDIACRWGGEEFLVILPDTDRAGALQVLDELRIGIGRERRGIPQFTVSVGIAEYNGQSVETLVRAADARMYEAKQTGRNRIV
ncbi:MAG: diguanylate cyclase [Gammaproteobacteria bacterium]